MNSPYKQIHIKSWACIAEARAYYLVQGFKASEIWEDYDILRKGRKEVMISYKGFLDVKSSLIEVDAIWINTYGYSFLCFGGI